MKTNRAEEIKKLGAHDVKDAKEDEVHCKKLLSRKGSLECRFFSFSLNLYLFLFEKDKKHTHNHTKTDGVAPRISPETSVVLEKPSAGHHDQSSGRWRRTESDRGF